MVWLCNVHLQLANHPLTCFSAHLQITNVQYCIEYHDWTAINSRIRWMDDVALNHVCNVHAKSDRVVTERERERELDVILIWPILPHVKELHWKDIQASYYTATTWSSNKEYRPRSARWQFVSHCISCTCRMSYEEHFGRRPNLYYRGPSKHNSCAPANAILHYYIFIHTTNSE